MLYYLASLLAVPIKIKRGPTVSGFIVRLLLAIIQFNFIFAKESSSPSVPLDINCGVCNS